VDYMCFSDDHGYKKNYASILVFNNVFRWISWQTVHYFRNAGCHVTSRSQGPFSPTLSRGGKMFWGRAWLFEFIDIWVLMWAYSYYCPHGEKILRIALYKICCTIFDNIQHWLDNLVFYMHSDVHRLVHLFHPPLSLIPMLGLAKR
jgi:hypothetical protein